MIIFSAVYKNWCNCFFKLLLKPAVLDLITIMGLHLVHIVTKFLKDSLFPSQSSSKPRQTSILDDYKPICVIKTV